MILIDVYCGPLWMCVANLQIKMQCLQVARPTSKRNCPSLMLTTTYTFQKVHAADLRKWLGSGEFAIRIP